MKTYIKSFIFLFFLLLVDQATKFWARAELAHVSTIPIIKNFFHLTYVENKGAAFGMMQGRSGFFALASLLAIVLLLLYYKGQKQKNASHIRPLLFISLTIIAGAIGNLIDRLTLGFVTDFIDFRGIWMYVFNVADIYVVCATVLLCLYVLRYDKAN